jgi:hypothetical protein
MNDHLDDPIDDRADGPSEEEMILFHYGEAPDAAAVAARIAASPAARQRYEELQRLFAAADGWTPPDPPPSFESELWQRLQPRLAEHRDRFASLAMTDAEAARGGEPMSAHGTEPISARGAESISARGAEPMSARGEVPLSSRGAQRRSDLDAAVARDRQAARAILDAPHRFPARARRWLPAAAALLLLALGYLAGRYVPQEPPAPQALSVEARQRLLVETLAEHLERSQRLFTELANQGPEQSADLAGAQQSARELVAANRLYRTAAERGGRDGVAALLADMEPVLLELAHLPAQPQPADLEFLRQRIAAQGLLFKTRVASELLARSLEPPTSPTARSTV